MNITRILTLAASGSLFLTSVSWAEIRALTNDNGTVIQAELVSHQGGKVTLKRTDGKEFSVNPSIFSAEDEAYIKKWMAKTPAIMNYNLKIEAQKKKLDGNSTNYGYKRVKNDLWTYLVTVTNNSQDPVSDLTVKYRVFYTNSADGAYSSVEDRVSFRMVEGTAKLDTVLGFNRTLQFSTNPVEIDVVSYDYGNRYRDEVKGCLIRVQNKAGDVVLEWRSPDVAMKEKTWANTETSRKNTNNAVIVR